MTIPSLDGKDPPLRLLAAFQRIFPGITPKWITQAPGRDMWVAAAVTSDHRYTLIAPDFETQTSFSAHSAKTRRTLTNRPLPRWARYAAGVLAELRARGMDNGGLDIVLVGGEPEGPRFEYASGMAVAALWHELHGQSYTAQDLIEIVDRMRRVYIDS